MEVAKHGMSVVELVHDGSDKSEGAFQTIIDPGRLSPPAELTRLDALFGRIIICYVLVVS